MSKYNDLVAAMGNHSLKDFPREACGIITNSFNYVPCRNLSKNPKTSFIVYPITILQYKDYIWGFFHSHPGSSDPIPSYKDADSTIFTEYSFIVGFGTKFYKYWLEDNNIKFESLNENHITVSTADK